MKKAFSLLLAVVLVLTISIPAFATETTNKIEAAGGSQSTTVTGTYQAGTAGGTVYSVTIAWEGMDFTYNGESKKVWDPETLKYSGEETEAGWAASNASITVTNRSNVNITATPSFTAASNYNDVGMQFSCVNSSAIPGLPIASAAPADTTGTGEAKSDTIAVTPTGSLPDTVTEETTIGEITVTVTNLEAVDSSTYQTVRDMASIALTNTQTKYTSYDSETSAVAAGAKEYTINSEVTQVEQKLQNLKDSETTDMTDYTDHYITAAQIYNAIQKLVHRA